MILATVGILLIVIVAATAGAGDRSSDRRTTPTALAVLDGRLARGEISADEHRRRRHLLSHAPARRGPTSRAVLWLLGGLGALLLVAGPLTAGPGAGWWAGHPAGMAEHMNWNPTSTTPAQPPDPDAPDLVIEAGDLWFEPARVEIEAGTTTNLVLDNTGQVFHDLSIPELDLHLGARAGETASTALRSPAAGRYEFTCTVPGHAAGGMRGELVIDAAP